MCPVYISKIEIENVGPISNLNFDLEYNDEKATPIILVGENGSGKSILLSYLVNTIISAKQSIYEDAEVEQGRLFKYRDPSYVKSGSDFAYSKITLSNQNSYSERQLKFIRKNFEENCVSMPANEKWKSIPEDQSSTSEHSFLRNQKEIADIFEKQCCLYFPVNRFEEPAWLNLGHLRAKTSFTDLKKLSGYSNRNIIQLSPMKENVNWILDIIFDKFLYEMKTHWLSIRFEESGIIKATQILDEYAGPSTSAQLAINETLKAVLRSSESLRFGIANRKSRRLSIMKNEKEWIPNIFQLSTGETQLLNLFLSIIRDYDASDAVLKEISDISGIVIVDEIDAHLHTSLQRDVLPKLIKSFPRVQFIVTTHSPLFLLGMEQQFGQDGIHIINLPTGVRLTAGDFSEFNAAYEAFKATTQHREEIQRELEASRLPMVIVEGDIDIKYIRKAAEFAGKLNILDTIQLKPGDGFGNLDKIWKSFDNPIGDIVTGKILLLFDCDIKKQEQARGKVFRKTIPTIIENPIKKGIENLFSEETIEKIENANSNFIDIEKIESRVRGSTSEISTKCINECEKMNVCNWLCENGTAIDFAPFSVVLEFIEEFARR